MDVFECIRTRRSIRKFKELKPVPWDKVVTILEAGKFAPNAGNLHNFKFIAIRDPVIRKKNAEAANQPWMEQATLHIIICSEPVKSKRFYGTRGERLYTVQDCAAAAENMLLTAHSLGLGGCWVGAFDEDKIRHYQNLPETVMVHSILAIGYADEKPESPPKYRIETCTFIENWGQRKNIPFSQFGWWSVRWEKMGRDTMIAMKKAVRKFKEKRKEKMMER